MKFSASLLSGLTGFILTSASTITRHEYHAPYYSHNAGSTCITPGMIPNLTDSQTRIDGVVLFQALDMIDVFGPLGPLQILSLSAQQLNLHLMADTLDPVSTDPLTMNKFNSSFFPTIPPTNTFEDDLELDLLIVPGGPGAKNPNLWAVTGYVTKMYPKVESGVLDQLLATTNKNAWAIIKEMGPRVTYGLNLIFAFIGTFWGLEQSERIANIAEHVPRAATDGPFSKHLQNHAH
ncbi:hypothetical protein FBEOM_10548 [Fusarium beomiforme]|uniref:DJ-1/PfpI domain-containing protein n=1 Tax=Fusarium beomiforme TaxID=44412 RepID=A0A9P5AC72_9HYPO|nr:hypothetical protein FBEOM_10548 [Fusarium beomiforme]